MPGNQRTVRDRADWASRIIGAVVFGLGAAWLIATPVRPFATEPARTTMRTSAHETMRQSQSPSAPVTFSKSSDVTVAKETPRATTFVDEIFTNRASVILMRLALAALAAFVSSAFAQRLILSQFALKIGPSGLELGPLEDISDTLQTRLVDLEESTKEFEKTLQRIYRRLGTDR
ncbi:MAG: hypothetical protein ABR548_04460 [Actinomycetota bacterium]